MKTKQILLLIFFLINSTISNAQSFLEEPKREDAVKNDDKPALALKPDFIWAGNSQVGIPSIEILNDNTFTRKYTFGHIKLFAGTPVNYDSSTQRNDYFLFPTASRLGFSTMFGCVIWKSNAKGKNEVNALCTKRSERTDSNTYDRLAVSGEFNFVNKARLKNKKLDEGFSAIHCRLGLEIVPVHNVFSLYARANWFRPVTNMNSFRNFTSAFAWQNTLYLDYGLRFHLNNKKENKDNGIDTIIEFNFIGINSKARTLLNTTDLTTFSVQITLAKTLLNNRK
jgi:hypothetical protein